MKFLFHANGKGTEAMAHIRDSLILVVLLAASCAIAPAQVAWDSSNVGNSAVLTDIVMPSKTCGYVVGAGGTIAKTTDGGLTWAQQSSGTLYMWATVAFTDTLHGCTGSSNLLRYTTNGGTSWLTPQTAPSHGTKSIAFGSPTVGVAVGTGGQIIRTTDGGANWAMVVSGVSQSLFGVTYADSVNVVAVGNNRIIRSTDGGQSWSIAWSPVSLLWDVMAASQQVIVAVGAKSGRGVVFRSTDRGVQWDSVVAVSSSYLIAVSFCSPDTGFALTWDGGVFRTVNGGSSWDSLTVMPPGAGVSSIAVSSPLAGMISGDRGMVYYTSKGFAGVSEEPRLPNQPVLYQNFPNPFNPSTSIRFDLPQKAHVLLAVYNLLGQRVVTLLQGEKEAGHHELKFDASRLSSGVYFYRIQAGDFGQTRKFVILR